MYNHSTRLILILCSMLFLACQASTSEGDGNQNTPSAETPAASVEKAPSAENAEIYLPSIPIPEIQKLWNDCNQVDYLFHSLPISTSLDNNPSVRVHLRHISETPVPLFAKERCGNPIGRIFYKQDGSDLMEADMYYSQGCTYYVFLHKGKAVYSNLMTPEGLEFFNQLFASVQNQTN